MTDLLTPSRHSITGHAPSSPRPAPARGRACGSAPSRVPAIKAIVRLRPSVAAPSLARNHARWICTGHGVAVDVSLRVVLAIASLAVNALVFTVAFRVATTKNITTRQTVPGATFAA